VKVIIRALALWVSMEKVQSTNYQEAYEGLNKAEFTLFKKFGEMVNADNGNLYQLDFLSLAASKRSSGNIKGFKLLIDSKNMAAARSLLRVQIDTFLRFSAISLVDNADGFAKKILTGSRINQLKDKDGNKMSDAYLVKKLSKDYDWLKVVYDDLCGYIHFSNKHFFDSLQSFDDKNLSVGVSFGGEDDKYPERAWVEIIDCFTISLNILFLYFDAYIESKSK
jgi:hypothetical protein